MKYMNRIIISLLAVCFLLAGVTGCQKTVNIKELEKELVGVWWDEYPYSDVTEEDVPFSNVLLAIIADEDHTGCIYLAVFDDAHSAPLAVYGGPKDAGFQWRLLENGSVELIASDSGENVVLTRADADSGSNYGNDMTNVSNTNVTYTDGNMTASNGNYSGTLTKADPNKQDDINKKLVEFELGLDLPPMGDPENLECSTL